MKTAICIRVISLTLPSQYANEHSIELIRSQSISLLPKILSFLMLCWLSSSRMTHFMDHQPVLIELSENIFTQIILAK